MRFILILLAATPVLGGSAVHEQAFQRLVTQSTLQTPARTWLVKQLDLLMLEVSTRLTEEALERKARAVEAIGEFGLQALHGLSEKQIRLIALRIEAQISSPRGCLDSQLLELSWRIYHEVGADILAFEGIIEPAERQAVFRATRSVKQISI